MLRLLPVRFRTKLLASHVGLVVLVLFVVSLILERTLAADLEAQRDEVLVKQARGATDWVSSGRHPHRVASRLAAIVQAEVTIFDGNGCVVGSSVLDDLPENAHCDEPQEIAEARRVGVGRASRPRGNDRFIYVAVPADDGIVIELGVSSRDIETPIAAMRKRLLIAALIASAAAIVLGLLASRLAARPLLSMAKGAARIATGDYDVRFPPLAKDEFGALADALGALARQLSADMERIRKLESTRRDFVANVTHELRTPVAAIQGYAETLRDGQPDPEKAKQFTDALYRHAQRISALVDGLLRLAELEARGDEPALRERVDLFASAREIAETLSPRAKERGIEIRIDIEERTFASGDETRVAQVLENLVDNALKYGAKERITIAATPRDESVVISVSDDGPGIEPEHVSRVFERFYRVDAGRSRDKGGAGLGLAIVKHLVESMGGSIAIRSEVGVGTTFDVTLRAAPRRDGA